jgi:hypothetical protein
MCHRDIVNRKKPNMRFGRMDRINRIRFFRSNPEKNIGLSCMPCTSLLTGVFAGPRISVADKRMYHIPAGRKMQDREGQIMV